MFAKLLKARCASDPVHLPNYAQMEATKKLHWARNKGSIQAQAWRGRLHCIFKACSRMQSSVLKSRPFLRLPTPFCEPAIVDAVGTVRTFFLFKVQPQRRLQSHKSAPIIPQPYFLKNYVWQKVLLIPLRRNILHKNTRDISICRVAAISTARSPHPMI